MTQYSDIKPDAVAIFDLDETIIKGNYPEHIFREWAKENYQIGSFLHKANEKIKFLLNPRIYRRIEYWHTVLIDEDFVKKTVGTITHQFHKNVVAEILNAKERGLRPVIVSAGPIKYLNALGEYFELEVFGSRTKFGFTYSDILGKKDSIYKKMNANGILISEIYSDQVADLSKLSEKNYLVINGDIKLYK